MDKTFFFTYKNQHIAYQVIGTGKALIILHGWGSSKRVMMPIAKSLEHIRSCYAIDFPGFGESNEPSKPWTIDDYADAIERLFQCFQMIMLMYWFTLLVVV